MLAQVVERAGVCGSVADTDLLFEALADPSRRKLPDLLYAHDGEQLSWLSVVVMVIILRDETRRDCRAESRTILSDSVP